MLVNLPCKRIQADEIWAFSYAKQKNVPTDKLERFGYGDIWTSTAMCADTKLVPSWISTSYVERQNLTMRMQMRRFTRLLAIVGAM